MSIVQADAWLYVDNWKPQKTGDKKDRERENDVGVKYVVIRDKV